MKTFYSFPDIRQLLACLMVLAFSVGCAHQPSGVGGFPNQSETATGADSSFAREACQTSAGGIEIGKLAAVNTKNKELRRFAKRLSAQHAIAEKELGRIFAQKRIEPEPNLNPIVQTAFERLVHLKGAEFDRAFKEEVTRSHENAIVVFERQASEGSDPELRTFAQRHLPELREHLAEVKGLAISPDTEGPSAQPDYNTGLSSPIHRNIPR